MDNKFWAAAFTLTGTIIGAGILGLPYVFAKSGFLIGLFWIVFLGLVMTITNLYLGEVTLKTRGRHQLTGLARKYLGRVGENFMFFAMVFGVYSALLAYLIGEGVSFSNLIFGSSNYAFYFGVAFWLVITVLLREGMKGLRKVETYGVLAIVSIVIGMFVWFLPSIDTSNLIIINTSNLFLPIGVVLFALLGFTSIPEIRQELKGSEKLFRKAILVGATIPIILYVLFTSVFVGVLGMNVSEVATISFGPLITILGIFTMFTSYFVLSFSLKDMYKYDFGFSKTSTFFWASLFPLLLFIFATLFSIDSFINIIGIGGVIAGGLTGVLVLLMNKKAKVNGNRKSEYSLPINWFIIIVFSLIFILGVVMEFAMG